MKRKRERTESEKELEESETVQGKEALTLSFSLPKVISSLSRRIREKKEDREKEKRERKREEREERKEEREMKEDVDRSITSIDRQEREKICCTIEAERKAQRKKGNGKEISAEGERERNK